MDGNRDDARRCLQLAAAALAAADLPKASRLLDKSRRMYPLPAEQDALAANIAAARSSASAPPPASSTMPPPSSSSPPSAKKHSPAAAAAQRNNRDAKPAPPRPATPAMRAAVRAVLHPPDRSHYDVLGVPRDADPDAIKRAYRKLALRLHPDRNFAPDADDAFKRVSRAFMTLSDPARRDHYDRCGADDPADPSPSPAAAAFQQHHQYRQYAPFHPGAMPGCYRRRFSTAPTGHVDFETFLNMNGGAVSADDLLQFLFTGMAPQPPRGRSASRQHPRRPRRRRATSPSAGSDDDGDGDGDDDSGDDSAGAGARRPRQNASARAAYDYDGDGDGATSIWARLRPLLWIALFMLFSALLSEPAHAPFSLHRTPAHPARHETRNGSPFFTAARAQARDARLWRAVDRAVLERLRAQCQRESDEEARLRARATAWLVGRDARESARRRLKAFRKPACDSALSLYNAILRYG